MKRLLNMSLKKRRRSRPRLALDPVPSEPVGNNQFPVTFSVRTFFEFQIALGLLYFIFLPEIKPLFYCSLLLIWNKIYFTLSSSFLFTGFEERYVQCAYCRLIFYSRFGGIIFWKFILMCDCSSYFFLVLRVILLPEGSITWRKSWILDDLKIRMSVTFVAPRIG